MEDPKPIPATVAFESCSSSIKVKTKLYGPVGPNRLEAERIIGKHRATQLNFIKWERPQHRIPEPFEFVE